MDLSQHRNLREKEISSIADRLEAAWEKYGYLQPDYVEDNLRRSPYYIGVIGSRTFNDRAYFNEVMQRIVLLHSEYPITIVSGGANGADTMAHWFAEENGFKLMEFLPEWGVHGKQAAYVRNVKIVEASNEVIAFWDGKSRGTAMSLYLCARFHVPKTIIRIDSRTGV